MSFVTTESQTVTINSPADRVELTCIKGYGAFQVMIEDANWPGSGASTVFQICANSNQAQVQKTVAVTGMDGEQLMMIWNAGQRPMLAITGRVNPEYLPKKYIVVATCLSTSANVRPS